MRLAWLLPLMFLLVACDDSALKSTSDLSMPDLLASTDLRSTALSCAQAQACILACTSTNNCVPACIDQLSAAATPYFNALEACSEPACASARDGGAAPPCAVPGSTACMNCISDSCAAEETACVAH